jgi:hypothetical protein
MGGQNKRAFPRFRTKSSVYASFPGGVATVRDISLGGILLKDREPIDVGSAVRLCLHLDGKTSFCQAVVSRTDLRGMGLRFTEISREDRRVLSGYLMEIAAVENRERLRAGLANGAAQPSSLAAMLAQRGAITQEQLDTASAHQGQRAEQTAYALVRSGAISEDDLAHTLQRTYGLPVIDLAAIEPMEEALGLVSQDLARRYEALPIGVSATHLTVAIADPSNVAGLQEIKLRAGRELRPMLAPAVMLQRAIDRFYGERIRAVG